MAEPEAATRKPRALRDAVVFWLLVALHVALVFHFAPPRELFSGTPILTDSFAVEAYRAARVRLSFESGAKFWTYDPAVLAGQVAGLVEPLGTRVLVLGVLGLSRLGVGAGNAFNGIVFGMHWLVPFVSYAAARLFGLRKSAALVVMGLWSSLWFFDGLVHFSWFSGRISWSLASAVVILSLAAAHRFRVSGSAWTAALSGVSSLVASLLHPVVGLFGAANVLVWSISSLAGTRARRGVLAASAFAAVLALVPFSSVRGALSSEPLATVFHVGPLGAWWDFWEVVGPGYGAPGAARTLFRSVALVMGVMGLFRFRKDHDPRFAPLALFIGSAVAFAYWGALFPLIFAVDFYWFAIPAAFAAALPAAHVLDGISWRELASRGPLPVRLALLVAVLLGVPRVARTVLTYFPELLPDRVFRSPADLGVSALVGLNEPQPFAFADAVPRDRFRAVAAFLMDAHRARGRVLVDDPALAGFLAVTTPLPVLGPLAERGAPSGAADPTELLRRPFSPGEVSSFLRRYAVGWVVLDGPLGPLDEPSPDLDAPFDIGGVRVRPVVPEPSLFAEGSGRVTGVRADSISVADAAGQSVTLRFHYDAVLKCRPNCRVMRRAEEGDKAGFVTVPSPPPSFELYAE